MDEGNVSDTFTSDQILTMIKEEIALISPRMSTRNITFDNQLADIGLDSVDTAGLVSQLEERTSASIPDGELGYVSTFRDLAELLIRHRDPQTGSQEALTPTDTPANAQPGR